MIPVPSIGLGCSCSNRPRLITRNGHNYEVSDEGLRFLYMKAQKNVDYYFAGGRHRLFIRYPSIIIQFLQMSRLSLPQGRTGDAKKLKSSFCLQQQTNMIYQKGQRYLTLYQYRQQKDQNGELDCPPSIIKCYLLDENLCGFWQGPKLRDLAEQIKQKQKQNQAQIVDTGPSERSLFKKSSHQFFPIKYRTNTKMHKFTIGRSSLTFSGQHHVIESELVSRQHCEIIDCHDSIFKAEQYCKTIRKTLQKKTTISSKTRQLCSYLWGIIFSFIRPVQGYFLVDLESRNGTWVYPKGTSAQRLLNNFQYQFEEYQQYKYSIKLYRSYTSADSRNLTVSQHNEAAAQIIKRFTHWQKPTPLLPVNKYVLPTDPQYVKNKQDHKVQVLIFKIQYWQGYQYYLIAVNDNSQAKFTIGYCFDINIKSSRYRQPNLHGQIRLDAGGWLIENAKLGRSGVANKVWVRLPEHYKYNLDTQMAYQIRIANGFYMHLDFHGF